MSQFRLAPTDQRLPPVDLRLQPATRSDADDVLALYRSLIGTSGCTWHADYPTAENIAHDLANGTLYVVRAAAGDAVLTAPPSPTALPVPSANPPGTMLALPSANPPGTTLPSPSANPPGLIGAVTVGDATDLVGEIKQFNTATVTLAQPCEIARFAVRGDQQSRGIGRCILNQALAIARAGNGDKFDGVCLLVSPDNAAALHLYYNAGFEAKGGLFNWGFQWDYLELRF